MNLRWPLRRLLVLVGAVACALTASGESAAAAENLVYTRRTLFAIPFQIERPSATAAEPTEVELFVSADRGAQWQPHAQAKPAQRSFAFRAPGDGEYWFAVQSIDAQGNRHPSQIHQPELRVVVDSVSPKLEIAARQGPAGEVVCQWTVRDATIDPHTFKLEQQSGGPTSLWRPIAVEPQSPADGAGTLSGQTTWWPQAPLDEVVLRCEIGDRAGNRALEQVRVQRSAVAARDDAGQRLSTLAESGGARGWPVDSQADSPFSANASAEEVPPPPPRGGPKTSAAARRRVSESPAEEEVVPPVGARPEAATNTVGRPSFGGDNRDVASSASNAAEDLPAPAGNGAPPTATGAPPPLDSQFGDGAAASPPPPDEILTAPALPDGAPVRSPRARPGAGTQRREYLDKQGLFDLSLVPRGQSPQMLRTRRFELDYEVAEVGSSGISRVELWGTTDGGRTWESYAVDEDRQSPVDVTVHAEGLYGFRIAVRSGAGVGGQAPASGDLPDVWVGVDVTRPFARLLAAEPGAGEGAEQLTIRYEAADELLAQRPITLALASSPDGPWSTIADQLENAGEYLWTLDAGVPDQFYLQLTVRDEAGNEQTIVTRDPVSLDRKSPTGHIRHIRPREAAVP